MVVYFVINLFSRLVVNLLLLSFRLKHRLQQSTTMNRKFPISEGTISTHRCCLCGHLLSVPPIMSTGLESELYKCGRCEAVKCQTYTRTRLFEDVAQHLAFPCSYARCDRSIPWGLVDEHEKNCRHRTMKCPIYYQNCSEIIPADQLLQHFEDKHSKNIRTVESVWDLNIGYDYVYLVQYDNQYFLVYVIHLGGVFSVAVLAMEHSKYTRFNVKLLPSTDSDKFAVYFNDLNVIRYDERLHCYMCIRKKCNELHHPFSEKNKSGEMDLSYFTNSLKKELISSVKSAAGNLRYYITLKADPTVTEQPQQFVEEDDVHVQEEPAAAGATFSDGNVEVLKRALVCPYCMTYMAAPIFTCSVGHTICNVCRPRLKKCPMCAEPFGDCRNYTLEEIAKDAKVPCQYDSKGCTFLGNASKMFFHEGECSFNDSLKE